MLHRLPKEKIKNAPQACSPSSQPSRVSPLPDIGARRPSVHLASPHSRSCGHPLPLLAPGAPSPPPHHLQPAPPHHRTIPIIDQCPCLELPVLPAQAPSTPTSHLKPPSRFTPPTSKAKPFWQGWQKTASQIMSIYCQPFPVRG